MARITTEALQRARQAAILPAAQVARRVTSTATAGARTAQPSVIHAQQQRVISARVVKPEQPLQSGMGTAMGLAASLAILYYFMTGEAPNGLGFLEPSEISSRDGDMLKIGSRYSVRPQIFFPDLMAYLDEVEIFKKLQIADIHLQSFGAETKIITPHRETIEARFVNLTADWASILMLFNVMPELKKLSFINCLGPHDHNFLGETLASLTKLEKFEFTEKGTSPFFLETFAKNAVAVKKLTLHDFGKWHKWEYDAFRERSDYQFAKVTFKSSQMTTENLNYFGTCYPNMGELKFTDCNFDDNLLIFSTSQFEKIEKFTFKNCHDLTISKLHIILAKAKNGAKVEIENCRYLQLRHIKELEKEFPELDFGKFQRMVAEIGKNFKGFRDVH